jgi:hypothetical protein
MKIVYTNWFPFGPYHTINLFGILFTKRDHLTRDTILHEQIHTAQMKEMLYIFFYLWYGLEYIIIRFFHKKQNNAYHDVSFEEEAHDNVYNWNYLETRKHYAWFKYIKIGSNK